MFCEVIVHRDFVQSPEDNHACPNFLAMNKIAAIKHFTNAKDQKFAREHFYVPLRPRHTLMLRTKLPSDKNPHHQYGAPSLRDEPFAHLLHGAYQNEWSDMNNYFKSKHPENFCLEVPKFTRTSTKGVDLYYQANRKKFHPKPSKERFILTRFKNVAKQIDNYNSMPLKREGPYHVFYGCHAQHKQ
ncbi:unnamed protein product [Sphagnum jensenii]|uniref:Uncharacterized protein n=1 Tax=Sphagnum jensenii TaxID=128206 RepID=A0ABP1B1X6_9BRYO